MSVCTTETVPNFELENSLLLTLTLDSKHMKVMMYWSMLLAVLCVIYGPDHVNKKRSQTGMHKLRNYIRTTKHKSNMFFFVVTFWICSLRQTNADVESAKLFIWFHFGCHLMTDHILKIDFSQHLNKESSRYHIETGQCEIERNI